MVAAASDEGTTELGPDLILGAAGHDLALHPCNGGFGSGDRRTDEFEFGWLLDRLGAVDDRRSSSTVSKPSER